MNELEGLLDKPLGKEIVRALMEDVHAPLVREAEEAGDPNSAFGLLKKASGVITAIDHLKMRSVVSKDEEGEN